MAPVARAAVVSVQSLLMPMHLIDEDPDQVRRHFDPKLLNELARSIRLRGVRTPISIRPHPLEPGRFLINHGARRFRASRIAELTEIPVYIDNSYCTNDQATENLQREALTPIEIAKFLDKRLKDVPQKKSDLARELGKSPAFVTRHLALLHLPPAVKAAVERGDLADVQLIYRLAVLEKKSPADAALWIETHGSTLSRETLKWLEKDAQGVKQEPPQAAVKSTRTATRTVTRPCLTVESDGRPAELLYKRRASSPQHALIRDSQDGSVVEVPIAQLRLLSLDHVGGGG